MSAWKFSADVDSDASIKRRASGQPRRELERGQRGLYSAGQEPVVVVSGFAVVVLNDALNLTSLGGIGFGLAYSGG